MEVKAPKRFLSVALPKISAQRRAHERQQWEARRLVAFRSQILRQSPGSSQADAQRTALGYVAASAARLDGDLQAANQRLESTRVECTAPGMRAALRAVADAANVNAEDLALLAGVSLSAAQSALDETQEGRLATPHRLFSANEERSAEMARSVAVAAGLTSETIDVVAGCILATRHREPPANAAQALTLDVDLAILGETRRRFDSYDAAIRAEYAWVPEETYRRERGRILAGFAKRDDLFTTPWFRRRYMDQARANLLRAVCRLEAGHG